MNMNDVKNLYDIIYDLINDYLLLSAELKEAVDLMSLLSECVDEDGLANNPTVAALRAAVLYLRRIANDINSMDNSAEKLIKPLHDCFICGNHVVREGA